MHYEAPFSHNGYMKSLEIYESYITLFFLEKNQLFDNIILIQNRARHITQSDWNNYLVILNNYLATIKETHRSVMCSV